jgi:hypothetical protein
MRHSIPTHACTAPSYQSGVTTPNHGTFPSHRRDALTTTPTIAPLPSDGCDALDHRGPPTGAMHNCGPSHPTSATPRDPQASPVQQARRPWTITVTLQWVQHRLTRALPSNKRDALDHRCAPSHPTGATPRDPRCYRPTLIFPDFSLFFLTF